MQTLFPTRQEDPDTPVEVRAILLPGTRVPASRARVRRGQADSGSWPGKVEASRRHLRRGVHAREADGRFKRSELREPAVGRWVDWAAPWPTGPDPRCQLGRHHPFSVGLPPGLVGPWRAGTCLGFMPAPDHGVQTRSLHQRVETEKLGSVGGDGCGWVPAGAAPLRDPGKARLSNKNRVCLATAPGYRTLLVEKTVGFLKTLSSSDSAPKPPSSSSFPEVFPDPPSSGRRWVWGRRVGEGGGKGTDKGEGRGRRGRS